MSRDYRLESMLASLGDSIDWPTPSPPLSRRVMARIESEPAAGGRRSWRRSAIALGAVLIVTFVMVLSPSAREAVADLLGAAGVRVSLTSDEAPTTGATLTLGELLHQDEAQDAVDFEFRTTADDVLGSPDAVYLSDSGQVTMVWAGGPTLPAAGNTGIGLLLAQHQASGGVEVGEKAVGPGAGVQSLEVEGQPALWIEGAPHTLTLLDREGNPIEETTRLAANVLLWDANGVAHRLETTGDLERALAIVENLEPLP